MALIGQTCVTSMFLYVILPQGVGMSFLFEKRMQTGNADWKTKQQITLQQKLTACVFLYFRVCKKKKNPSRPIVLFLRSGMISYDDIIFHHLHY